MQSTRLLLIVFLHALVAIGLPGLAWGQVALVETPSAYWDWEYVVDFDASYQLRSDVDAGGGFDRLRFQGGLDIGGPLTRNVRVRLDVDYAHTGYDFGGASTSGCADPAACFRGRPWNGVHTVDIAPSASLVLNDSIQIIAGVPLRWEAESDSDRNGLVAGAIAGVRIDLAERFTTMLGIGVMSELEQDAAVFPVIALDWRLAESLRLETRGGPYQGGEAALLWGASDAFQLRLSAGYDRQRFRLTRRPVNPDGVGQYTAVPLLIGMRLNLSPTAWLGLEGGISVGGRLGLYDAHGRTLLEEDFGTAGLFRGSLHILF